MTTEKKSLFQHALMYGVYMAIALIAFSLVTYLTKTMYITGVGFITYGIILAGLFLIMRHYRDKENEGILTFGTGVKLGVWVSVLAGFISGVFSYVLLTIDPTLIDQMIQIQQEEMLKNGMPEAQVEQMEAIMRKMANPVVSVLSSILGLAILGTLFALVVALIVKKNPGNPFQDAVKEIQ